MNTLAEIELLDRTVATGTAQTLTCTISELSQDSPVTWVDPDDNDILTTDTTNYNVEQGNFQSGSKESTLVIQVVKLQTLASSSIFKCKLKSSLYPAYSPEIVKSMTLTVTGLSKLKLIN